MSGKHYSARIVLFGVADLFQGFDVSKVLRASRRTLVADKVGKRGDAYLDSLDVDSHRPSERFLKIEPGRGGDNINSSWGNPDLKDSAVRLEIFLRYVLQRGTETP